MSEPKKKFLERVFKVTSGVFQQAMATVLAAGAVIAFESNDKKEREDRHRNHEFREEERTIIADHRETSECMAAFYGFKNKHGNDYADRFVEQMRARNRTEEVEKINKCRSRAKDHWELVIAWAEEYQDILREKHLDKLQKYRSRYQRFVDIVKPLDKLEGYSDAELREIYTKDNVFKDKN